MMQQLLHVEVEAENLDVAVERALGHLKCTRADAEIEVLRYPSSGFLGIIGGNSAQVRVNLHDRGIIARQVADRLLQLCEFDAEVDLASSNRQIELKLTADDPSRVIGYHGQTLDALQTLVELITNRLTAARTPILLDVDGYRSRRERFLKQLGRQMCRKVRKSGKPATTPPLVLSDRRILHEFFKGEKEFESLSRDQEGGRKIVILQLRG